jgi:hypothetical protein
MKNAADKEIEQELISNLNKGIAQETKLETDDKVLARITDGIYRLPGSAIRELISNAFDADAENVYVDTDAPRFNSMTIRDDGNGMSIDTLVNMLRHIGGSAKRTNKGKSLKVTDNDDNSLSLNKKRKIIGKIGIGLFSVAQLTRDFEIITKQNGCSFYLRAKVTLFNYSDELAEAKSTEKDNRGKSFQTGEVKIWTEETDNLKAHGTDIILHNIKQSAKDQLKSVDIWGQTENETDSDDSDDSDDFLNSSKAILPDFHIGYLSGDEDGVQGYGDNKDQTPSLPWENGEEKDKKFSKLYDAILEKTRNAVSPKLSSILDNYLNMIWTLGLSIPLEYIETHPFGLTKEQIPDIYAISNKHKGQVTNLYETLGTNKFIGDELKFFSHKRKYDFTVFVDGIKLYRPIKFTNLPESKAMIKKPILFVGQYKPNLSQLDNKDSGGELEFEAYVMWSPKVSPKDHNGSLIRIHDASGILFDETFMKHQVAEHTIKSQLTIEIFVSKGLDSALNIDRESFNIAHPHYQIVMRWLHSAIRQVVNRYKSIKKSAAKEIKDSNENAITNEIKKVVDNSYSSNEKDPLEISRLTMVNESGDTVVDSDINDNAVVANYDNYIISETSYNEVKEELNLSNLKQKGVFKRSEAILQILDSYDLLENLTVKKQENLVLDLIKILSIEG